jgi:hypothetical protein
MEHVYADAIAQIEEKLEHDNALLIASNKDPSEI